MKSVINLKINDLNSFQLVHASRTYTYVCGNERSEVPSIENGNIGRLLSRYAADDGDNLRETTIVGHEIFILIDDRDGRLLRGGRTRQMGATAKITERKRYSSTLSM